MRETDATDQDRHAETGADPETGTRDHALQEETGVVTDMSDQGRQKEMVESRDQSRQEEKIAMLASAKTR